jgi:hypothetical protein
MCCSVAAKILTAATHVAERSVSVPVVAQPRSEHFVRIDAFKSPSIVRIIITAASFCSTTAKVYPFLKRLVAIITYQKLRAVNR